MLDVLLLTAGLALLVAGAELLVRGAARLALHAGISSLVVGLTVVAFGTSSPELVVSAVASLKGNASIALGNVLGSNIFNVLVILGLCALILPLRVARQVIRLDLWLMLAVSVLALVLGLDGRYTFSEGVLLVSLLIVYTTATVYMGRRAGKSADDREKGEGELAPPGGVFRNVALIVAGLGLLVWGSSWLVSGATGLAHRFGVSDIVIGLTIVAAGTSLPEVATSVVASIRGERDIAVGNVVGSNIFNLLGVLGLAGILAPQGVAVGADVLSFDLPVMLLVALICVPVFVSGRVIDRAEGTLLVLLYLGYTIYLVLSTAHESSHGADWVALGVGIAATAAFLIFKAIRDSRRRRRRS